MDIARYEVAMIGKVKILPDPRLAPTAADRDRCLVPDVLYLLACQENGEQMPASGIAIGLAGCRRALAAEAEVARLQEIIDDRNDKTITHQGG